MVIRLTIFLFVFLFSQSLTAQQPSGSQQLEKLVYARDYKSADALFKKHRDSLFSAGEADSLTDYILPAGNLALKKQNADAATRFVKQFMKEIIAVATKPATKRQACVEAADFFSTIGENHLAYTTAQDALKYCHLEPGNTDVKLATIESNMGAYAQRMGNVTLSGQHHRKALGIYLSQKVPNYESLYISLNSMGGIMWYASKLDSARYYFNESLKALSKLDTTPYNKYYRPAIVQNNISAIYSNQGQVTEGIQTMKAVINNIMRFLNTTEPHPKKLVAVEFKFQAIDNLAGMYKSLGDFKQAETLLLHSYRGKQAEYEESSPEIFKSLLFLGQLYREQRQNDKALTYLLPCISLIDKQDGDYLFWRGDACYSTALAYDQKKDYELASRYFDEANTAFQRAYAGEYDEIYLEFLRNAGLFYAENGQVKKGLAYASTGYEYILKTQGEQSLAAFLELVNLAEIYDVSGLHTKSYEFSEKGLKVLDVIVAGSNNLLDSVKMEIRKPKAILFRAKAQYAQLNNKTRETLEQILTGLNEALLILERRKSILGDAESVGLMMADHEELIGFIKKINLELFSLTKDATYLDRLLSLHESVIYNRIRSRLDRNDTIPFAHIPSATRNAEIKMKQDIANALVDDSPGDTKIARYMKAVQNLSSLHEKIRREYPVYYTMRYSTIFKPMDKVRQALPHETTVVRYLFVGDELYAFVADKNNQQFYHLNSTGLAENIQRFTDHPMNPKLSGGVLHDLYKQLWAPLAGGITNSRIIVIPDGSLFNLSFELLTPEKTEKFTELISSSLLARHTISYQYSLLLIDQKSPGVSNKNNFIGFAPGFMNDTSSRYSVIEGGSLDPRQGHLALLPLRFTLDLVKKAQKLFGGKTFVHTESTEHSFKTNSADHQIIHIGTHAESNNLNPELSRLIFSGSEDGEEDNSLYLHEIYNCDLRSHLAVLTACESGKPGFKDGEGMISLAHAFNYAGSESMLTGLWKIDEQASVKIVEAFYNNLANGLTKDEALRTAKLSYLQTEEGRKLAPAYWGGLVIIGDVSPVAIGQSLPWYLIAAVTVILLLLVIAGRYYRKRQRSSIQPLL